MGQLIPNHSSKLTGAARPDMASLLARALPAIEERFLVHTYTSPRPALWGAAYAGLTLPLLLHGRVQRYRARIGRDEVRVLCVGRGKRFRALLDRLFDNVTPVGEEGRCGLWSPHALARFDADLVAANVHHWIAPGFRDAGWCIVPDAIRWGGGVMDIPRTAPSRSLRSDLKKVGALGYTIETAESRADWKEFFAEMVLPHAMARFGSDAWFPSPRLIREFTSLGTLYFLRDGERRVAGVCIIRTGRAAWVSVLGVRGGDRRLLEAGAIAAIYDLSFRWACEHGIERLDFGRTGPFLNDGLSRFKHKWGLTPVRDPLTHLVALRVNPSCKALHCAFAREPVRVEVQNHLRVFSGES